MKIAVGCPIRDRAWIVNDWIEHVRVAFEVCGLKPWWVFGIGIGPEGDDGTAKIATNLFKTDNGMWTIIHEPATKDGRNWNEERYEHLALYRNKLLHVVQAVQPDYFWSLDSDILVHPVALMTLLDSIEQPHKVQGEQKMFDAVGGKTYLSPMSRHITTWANLKRSGMGSGLNRHDSEGVFACEVIMAIKLMTPAAYHVPYSPHRLGEDIGWSLNCRDAGLTLGWDGRTTSKHVMDPSHVGRVDPRLGW